MDRFYDPASCRDSVSLAGLKAILNCKQVNSDTSKNYHAISHFLDKVLDGYLRYYAQSVLADAETGQLTSSIGEQHVIYRHHPRYSNTSIISWHN